jgi:TonB family protein
VKETEAHPSRSLGFLSRLHDGELSAGELAEFEAHRAACEECARAAEEYEAVLKLYKSSSAPAADSELGRRIARRLDARLRRPAPMKFLPIRVDVAWAAIMLVALAGALLTYNVVVTRKKEATLLTGAPASRAAVPSAAETAAEPQGRLGAPQPTTIAEAEKERSETRAKGGEREIPVQLSQKMPASPPADSLQTKAEPRRQDEDAAGFAPQPAAPGAVAENEQAPAEKKSLARAPAAQAPDAGVLGDTRRQEEQPIRIGPGVTAPVLLQGAEPDYSKVLGNRSSKPVVLEAVISKTGDVTQVKVIQSNPDLDDIFVNAVKQWKYKPAMKDDRPVAVYIVITGRTD